MALKIYLLEQDTVKGYDTYDSCIVAAVSKEKAILIRPSDKPSCSPYPVWCEPEHVVVTYLGRAAANITEPKVLLASFNAG